MMKFKVGQLVELINDSDMGAEKGATAVVTGEGLEYLYVKWVRDSMSHNQADGGYYPCDFKPVFRKHQQLLFSFMDATEGT